MGGALRISAVTCGLLAAAGAQAQSLTQAQLADEQLSSPSLAQIIPVKEPEPDRGLLQYALLDRLEWAPEGDSLSLDFSAFVGGETDRAWIGISSDGGFGPSLDYLELNALYSHVVAPGWDVQAGLRYDLRPHPQRVYLTLGTQADATERLWLGAFAYLSQKGELSGRLVGQYNQPLPGRFVIQPSFELDAYGSDVDALGVGRGLGYAELGLRLRYARSEKLAPYLGYSWTRLFGRTARIARDVGDEVEAGNVVLGLRSEF